MFIDDGAGGITCPSNETTDELLKFVEANPLPSSHTSSHWQHYGSQTHIRRQGDRLILQAQGFSAFSRVGTLPKLLCHLEQFSYIPVTARFKSFPRMWRSAHKLARRLKVDITRHEWSSAVVLSILADHFAQHHLIPKTFALIGDGDGFLGALLREYFLSQPIRIYTIELPKTLIFQACMYHAADPALKTAVLSPAGVKGNCRKADVIFVHPEQIEQIDEEIDCAVNVVSMQEMKPSTIDLYFSFLRRRSGPSSRFYCVGRLKNVLRGGEISSFYDYPWQKNDEIFLDGPCPYFRYFLDVTAYPKGPKILGLRIPLVNYFEGSSIHRLVHLEK